MLAPANLTDHTRMIARTALGDCRPWNNRRRWLPICYSDLLINDRLQRGAGLRMADIYRAIGAGGDGGGAVWALYTRIYEILWSLERGSLGGGKTDDRIRRRRLAGSAAGAQLRARLARGAGRFAALLLPHFAGRSEVREADRETAGTPKTPPPVVIPPA